MDTGELDVEVECAGGVRRPGGCDTGCGRFRIIAALPFIMNAAIDVEDVKQSQRGAWSGVVRRVCADLSVGKRRVAMVGMGFANTRRQEYRRLAVGAPRSGRA